MLTLIDQKTAFSKALKICFDKGLLRYNHKLCIIISLGVALLWPQHTYANKASYDELNKINKSIETEKRDLELLTQKTREINIQIQVSHQRMILLQQNIQANEKHLNFIQEKRKNLEKQKKNALNSLNAEDENKKNFLTSFFRLGSESRGFEVFNPGHNQRKIRSSILLNTLLPQVQEKTEKLSQNLSNLDEIEIKLSTQQELEKITQKEIQSQYAELNKLLQKRSELYQNTAAQSENKSKKIKDLSDKASNLKDLITSLENEEKKKLAKLEADRKAAEGKNKKTANASSKKEPDSHKNKTSSDMLTASSYIHTLPIKGKVVTHFGQLNKQGMKTQGITLEVPQQTSIICPQDGKVLFKGPFRNYGNLLIIKHNENLHSLIAGFQHVNAIVGQDVTKGEPLGTISKTDEGQAAQSAQLYYEIRENGNPIDPLTRVKK